MIEKCKDYAKKCGIKFNEKYDNGYSIALGGLTDGVTLKEITDSYSVFTNNGNYKNSKFIYKIVDDEKPRIKYIGDAKKEDILSGKYKEPKVEISDDVAKNGIMKI